MRHEGRFLKSEGNGLTRSHDVVVRNEDDFSNTRKEWTNARLEVKVQLSLPSLIDPLRRLSHTAIIIFFPGKLPFADDVGQWVKALLEGSFVEGVYFVSRGFYKLHLSDATHK